MKKSLLLSFAVACALAGCRPASAPSERPVLSVSIEPQRQLLESLVGDRFDVVTLLSRGSDPETYDPTLQQRRAVDNSEAFMGLGVFPFEESVAESLPAGVKFFNVASGIEPLYGTHSHCGHDHTGHHHHGDGDADPHLWTSVPNMRRMAANMTAVLCSMDSLNADYYINRLTAVEVRLDSLDRALHAVLDTVGNRSFAVWHPSLSYFARDYGLHQIAVGQESKEMPASRLKDVVDNARSAGVKVFFFQKQYDGRQAGSINTSIGSRLVDTDPLAYDWEKELTDIAHELARP